MFGTEEALARFAGTNTSLGGLIEGGKRGSSRDRDPDRGRRAAGPAPRAVVSVISTSLSSSNKHKAVSHRTVERRIGADVAIGPRCNIVGGGTYNAERLDVPMWKQGVRTGYSVLLEDDIGSAAVSVLGGVRVGHGSIVGAGADRSDGALATDAVDRVGSREACDPRRFGRYAFQNLPS